MGVRLSFQSSRSNRGRSSRTSQFLFGCRGYQGESNPGSAVVMETQSNSGQNQITCLSYQHFVHLEVSNWSFVSMCLLALQE